MRPYLWLGIVLIFSLLALPRPAHACPTCSAAIPESSGAEFEDQQREAMAYNYSIYLMAGTPYLLLGTFSFLVYRGLRQKSATERLASGDPLQAGDGGFSSCPPPPIDEGS